MSRSVLLTVVFTGLAAFAVGASAQVFPTTRQASVRVADLDLTTASGARLALARIQAAAVIVCGGAPNERFSDNEREEFAACHGKAVRRAAADLHAPALMALIEGQPSPLLARN